VHWGFPEPDSCRTCPHFVTTKVSLLTLWPAGESVRVSSEQLMGCRCLSLFVYEWEGIRRCHLREQRLVKRACLGLPIGWFRYVLHPWTAKYSHWMWHWAIAVCQSYAIAMPNGTSLTWSILWSHSSVASKDGTATIQYTLVPPCNHIGLFRYTLCRWAGSGGAVGPLYCCECFEFESDCSALRWWPLTWRQGYRASHEPAAA
jgi:hypothetical protein